MFINYSKCVSLTSCACVFVHAYVCVCFSCVCVCVQEDRENVQILPAGDGPQANLKRITTPYMTKYERARVLGTRALQIA